jgi:hypothetical protein
MQTARLFNGTNAVVVILSLGTPSMTQRLLNEFPDDEQNDFQVACERFGFIRDDFQITAEETYPPGGHGGPIRREVTVARQDFVRIYPAGNGTSWTVDFEDDLHLWVASTGLEP